MVNQGKPSRGCEVCRKRRIKCDEAAPSCSYCVKKGITCPGYKSQFDIAWRDQNIIAEKSVQRRKNASNKADRDKSVATQLARTSSNTVPRVLPQDREEYARNFFFSSYVCLPIDSNSDRGFMGCLYPVWLQAGPSSPLRPAVTAVALCLLDAWSFSKTDLPLSLSRSQYMRGTIALRNSLSNAEGVSDDVLMSALLLNMYEGVVSFMSAKQNVSPHIKGTPALVECRKRLPLSTGTSQKVLLGARSQVISRALSSGERVPSNVSSWIEVARDVPVTPGSQLDELELEVANLRASSTLQSRGTERAAGELRKAVELDQRLAAWMNALPDDWIPVRVFGAYCIPESVRESGVYHNYCDVYRSVFAANMINSYRCSRIKLQLTILDHLKHHNTVSDTPSMLPLEIIQEMADEICASVPFHLGNRIKAGRIDDKSVEYPHVAGRPTESSHYAGAAAFGGIFSMLRLSELMSLTVPLRLGQRQWIGGQMARVKETYLVQQ